MNPDTPVSRRLRDALISAAGAGASVEQLFGKEVDPREFTDEQKAVIERILPMVEAMYLMMMADEDASLIEREALLGAMTTLTDGAIGRRVLGWLLDRFEADLEGHGRHVRLHKIGSLLSGDREDAEAAFSLAAAIALADGRIDPAEREMVEDMASWFGLSLDRAQELLGDLSGTL